MLYKEFFSALAIVLTIALFLPYIRSIRAGDLKPHVFSWIIWGLGTFIVFLAQLAGHGGVGAWPIGISGLITLYIAWLAYQHRGDTVISGSDWLFLTIALSALPLWLATTDPVWAVTVLTLADLFGFGPTIRRAYHSPHQESLLFFALGSLRNLFVIIALEHYSMTTALFPAAVGIACLLLSLMLVLRRQSIPAQLNHAQLRPESDAHK
jgi:hypothetical protein